MPINFYRPGKQHMKETVDVSIIIVSFNTSELIVRCLASLGEAKTVNDRWEIIVVDNGSTDGSIKKISNFQIPNCNVKVIQNKQNLGFAKANNIGIKKSQGRYILLLNSDTEVSKGVIQSMLAFMDRHTEAGAATCKLVLPDGRMDPACHRGFPTPWAALTYFMGFERLLPGSGIFAQYHMGYKDISTAHEVDAISGAFFMVRKAVIDEVGLLDEDFFMYGEDLDWTYRIKQKGWKILFNPEVSVLHRKKQSGREHTDPVVRHQTERHFYEAMKLFYKKHYAKRYGWLVTQLILLGIKLKSLI